MAQVRGLPGELVSTSPSKNIFGCFGYVFGFVFGGEVHFSKVSARKLTLAHSGKPCCKSIGKEPS